MSQCFDPEYHSTSRYSSASQGPARQDNYRRADIAFQFIMLLALFGSFVWAFRIRKPSKSARSVYRLFTAAISVTNLTFTWHVVNSIRTEASASVGQPYHISNGIIFVLRSLAEILLLIAWLTDAGIMRKLRKDSIASAAHLALHVFSIISWVCVLVFQVAFLVQCAGSTFAEDTRSSRRVYNSAAKANFAYVVLYSIVVLESLVWGTVLLCSSMAIAGRERKSPKMIFFVVGISLLMRQIWTTAIDGIYEFGAAKDILRVQGDKVWFADHLFYYICTIVAFAALVAGISRSYDDAPEVIELPQTGPVPRPAAPVEHWTMDPSRDPSQGPILVDPEARDV